jgi:hypothetical protein
VTSTVDAVSQCSTHAAPAGLHAWYAQSLALFQHSTVQSGASPLPLQVVKDL